MKTRTVARYLLGACLALTMLPAQAAYWTGAAADNNFWTAGNWSGTAPTPGLQITESLFMTNAVGVIATNDVDVTLADGVAITVVNSTLDLTSSTNALVAKGLSGNSNNPVQLNLIQFINSTVTLQAVQAMDVRLSSTSSISLKGTGRSINSTQEPTSVTLGVGSSITFTAGTTDPDGTGSPATPRRSNGLSIFNASSLQSYAADALSGPLTDFAVTGSDLTPFGLLGGGDGVNGGAFTITALQTVVVVNSTEIWDGVANPRAADGVTLTGTGLPGDPAIYTIPKGMQITSTGKIQLYSPTYKTNDINFVIQGGDLQMDAGAVLNIERLGTRDGANQFILDLSVTNSITGAGSIGPSVSLADAPRGLTIQNVKNVSLAKIDVSSFDMNTKEFRRDVAITASGAVVVTGKIDTSDTAGGGDPTYDVTILANTIDVNDIDTRAFRDNPGGNDADSGNVVLKALAPGDGYSTNSVNNSLTNRITVRGAIRTFWVDPETLNGDVTLQSVVLQVVWGVIQINTNAGFEATQSLDVGLVQNGAAATNLFVDVSGSGQTVNYGVQWGGTYTPPTDNPPVFTTDPVVSVNATQAVAYVQTIAGSATDADVGNTLTYSKFSGPAWLTIAPNGALSGTPVAANACTNTWQIAVTDGTNSDTATLQIFVVAAPRWNDANNDFSYPAGGQDIPYTGGTLATNILYCGAGSLTFAKTAGPAWLSVAADGALSGTPAPSNILANTFTVTVSDGIFPAVPATLRIFVSGAPVFRFSPIVKADAFVSAGDYTSRSQSLFGSAVNPADANPATLTWALVSGPAWLTVASDGALSGTPSAGDIGTNTWIVSADNTLFLTTNTLQIKVLAAPNPLGPIEVVAREFWDGTNNPHAADGVVLAGAGSESDPRTYTVPRGLRIYGDGQIYNSLALANDSEIGALHIRFIIGGDLNLEGNDNAFVTGVHRRSDLRNLVLDLNGTNSIVGQGRIIGLGNQVNTYIFPFAQERDTSRKLTITNVNNVSLYDINVRIINQGTSGRHLLIKANGKVQVTSSIDNSDRDTGGGDGCDVEVLAGQVDVNGVDTRAFRLNSTSTPRKAGRIRLNALTAPGYSTGGNNALDNTLTIRGGMRANGSVSNGLYQAHNTVRLEGVIMNLQTNAQIITTNLVELNVGIIQYGASATNLFVNNSTDLFPYFPAPSPVSTNYVVNWLAPSLQISKGPGAGQATVAWTGTSYRLQTNSSVANPGGWVNVPGATSPAVFNAPVGNLFYRLQWP